MQAICDELMQRKQANAGLTGLLCRHPWPAWTRAPCNVCGVQAVDGTAARPRPAEAAAGRVAGRCGAGAVGAVFAAGLRAKSGSSAL